MKIEILTTMSFYKLYNNKKKMFEMYQVKNYMEVNRTKIPFA